MRFLPLVLLVLAAGCGGTRAVSELGLPGNVDSPDSLALSGRVPREARPSQDPVALRVEEAYRAALSGDLDRADALVDSLYTPGKHWRALGSVLAWIALRGNDRGRAIDAARLALTADSTRAANHNNRGIAFLLEGDPVSARRSFERARGLDPALPGPLYNLAITEEFYFMDHDAARRWYEQYLGLSDEDPDGLKSILGPDSARR